MSLYYLDKVACHRSLFEISFDCVAELNLKAYETVPNKEVIS